MSESEISSFLGLVISQILLSGHGNTILLASFVSIIKRVSCITLVSIAEWVSYIIPYIIPEWVSYIILPEWVSYMTLSRVGVLYDASLYDASYMTILYDDRAEGHFVDLDFIEPGKPTQNSFIERFNQTYRDEILDLYLFESLSQIRSMTAEWIRKYNEERPHDALDDLTPIEFLHNMNPPENFNCMRTQSGDTYICGNLILSHNGIIGW